MPGFFVAITRTTPITPPTAVSGLSGFLKADAGITKDGANKVSTWSDQSGNARHFGQAITGAQALWVTGSSGINGLPIVRGDGIAQFMSSSASLSNFVTAGAFTVYAVFKPLTLHIAPGSRFLSDAIYCDEQQYCGILMDNTPRIATYIYNNNERYSANQALTTGSAHYVETRRESLILYNSLDGDQTLVQSIAVADIALLSNKVDLFHAGPTSNFANIEIEEIFWFNVALSPANRILMRAYCRSRSGLGGF